MNPTSTKFTGHPGCLLCSSPAQLAVVWMVNVSQGPSCYYRLRVALRRENGDHWEAHRSLGRLPQALLPCLFPGHQASFRSATHSQPLPAVALTRGLQARGLPTDHGPWTRVSYMMGQNSPFFYIIMPDILLQ